MVFSRRCRFHQFTSSCGQYIQSSAVLLGLVICVVVSGCGDGNRAAVSGMVTLDGEPLEHGVINFFPTDGNKGPTAGGTVTNGRYEIGIEKGVAIGANRVNINSKQKTGRKIARFGHAGEGEAVWDELADVIPPQYNTKSKLVCDVQPGQNELNIDLHGRVPIESFADERRQSHGAGGRVSK